MSHLIIKSNLNFFKIKFKSQILSLYFEIMMSFLKKYKQALIFNTYMAIKTHIEYWKPNF